MLRPGDYTVVATAIDAQNSESKVCGSASTMTTDSMEAQGTSSRTVALGCNLI